MSEIMIQETELCTWQSLVQDSAKEAHITLNEEAESYLVYLLMRFAAQPDIAQSLFAMDYLNAQQLAQFAKKAALREIGDKCLLFAGLFPRRAQSKSVSMGYFVQLGKSAYHGVSELSTQGFAQLYAMLCEDFVRLMDVLLFSREGLGQTLLPLEAYELWVQTQSQYAKNCCLKDADFVGLGLRGLLH